MPARSSMPDLSVVEQKLIPPDAAREAVELFQQHRIDCWVFVGNEWLIANPTGDHVDRETRTIQTPPTVVPDFADAHFAAVGKIVGPSKDQDLRRAGHRIRCRRRSPGAPARRVRSPIIAMSSRRASTRVVSSNCWPSGSAVPQSEILVLGDMENDLEMFRKAGFAVAMGNATDAVKRAAQATTLSNDEDGFAVAIERYVLRRLTGQRKAAPGLSGRGGLLEQRA